MIKRYIGKEQARQENLLPFIFYFIEVLWSINFTGLRLPLG